MRIDRERESEAYLLIEYVQLGCEKHKKEDEGEELISESENEGRSSSLIKRLRHSFSFLIKTSPGKQ